MYRTFPTISRLPANLRIQMRDSCVVASSRAKAFPRGAGVGKAFREALEHRSSKFCKWQKLFSSTLYLKIGTAETEYSILVGAVIRI